ncbi:MAG: hypothetical protein COU81_01005 [Candidatus Portnoybacteria bacterium CG10_big_fil_rev_8_21_14_0_10_36_7]|uniref:Uncharacterized protein n=1 Tax=Candidatus Portnoybacteria bacterium CG10_big_fil_rev_8_21_14_0_10_36_7 TaxID=1974812 RepID=A0A2M8KEQ7_9BACT|nr:MAG: hypothetical protein COU81_01005 [Candidatus Portnoybacteria bacterium CG10_big_fil_rev_8_21_14_0_10_36_7]
MFRTQYIIDELRRLLMQDSWKFVTERNKDVTRASITFKNEPAILVSNYDDDLVSITIENPPSNKRFAFYYSQGDIQPDASIIATEMKRLIDDYFYQKAQQSNEKITTQ